MSIEQLQKDLGTVTSKCPSDLGAIPDYLHNYLLPFLETTVEELSAVDEVVYGLVHEAEDILHEESGAVFAGIITSGMAICTELAQRAGNDSRIMKLVREFRDLAKQGKEILEEIVMVDDDGEPEPEVAEAAEAVEPAQGGAE